MSYSRMLCAKLCKTFGVIFIDCIFNFASLGDFPNIKAFELSLEIVNKN